MGWSTYRVAARGEVQAGAGPILAPKEEENEPRLGVWNEITGVGCRTRDASMNGREVSDARLRALVVETVKYAPGGRYGRDVVKNFRETEDCD